MAGVTCLTLLSCLWEPVQSTLLSFLGTAVADSLSSLREWVVTEVRNRTFFWGNRVQQVNISSASLVGMDAIRGYLEEMVGYLKDDAVGMIGVYGMGGVGKTTLLEIINNKFHEIGAPMFEVVVWVTVSKDANILKIQKSIGDRFGLSLAAEAADPSSQAEEQAREIFMALSRRRFLLILDDVWEKLDLKLVGIPKPTAENKCKVILATRSKEVCRGMGVERLVKVKVLNESESWELFKKNVGAEVDLDGVLVNPHAKVVAKRCGGLPLALITVGRAMADANSRWEWQEAEEQLRESPHELPGMKDDVLSLLKFSFDKLKDDAAKQCLLYCCLFPEDYEIPVDQVIEYWVGEGFLDGAQSGGSFIRARNRGHGMVTNLKSACLLESAESRDYDGKLYVKMHDVVREMCLWLTGGQFDQNNTFLVCAGMGWNFVLPAPERWAGAKRISLMGNKLYGLPCNLSSCPSLQTLLCNSNSVISGPHQLPYPIRGGFFEFMPALRVLDLSSNALGSLPEEIGLLSELRYLNLQDTYIESLPKGLSKLENLTQLNLDCTPTLSHVPTEVIPTLRRLRVLGLYMSSFNVLLPNEPTGVLNYDTFMEAQGASSSSSSTLANMKDDESCWDKLEELRLTLSTHSSLQKLLNFDRMRLCTTDLQIVLRKQSGMTTEHLSAAFQRLENLRFLEIRDWSKNNLEVRFDRSRASRSSSLEKLRLDSIQKITVAITAPSLFDSLRKLEIHLCRGIRNVTWARQLPCLAEIWIFGCDEMEELLSPMDGLQQGRGGDQGAPPAHDCSSDLHMLKKMSLSDLPALQSISWQPMLLPSLLFLSVIKCPMLKKLPLGPESGKGIRTIVGEEAWWEGLEWYQDAQGQSIRPLFLPHFRAFK